jgi:hypothetical protein
MKKLYFMKLLSTLFLAVILSQFTSAQKKKILYVGADEVLGELRSCDKQMIDSLLMWGYDTLYLGHNTYDGKGTGSGVHSGIDGVFFGESCGSSSITPYGKNGDNFPVPAIALEAAAFGVEVPERWNLFKEESSVGAADGGGIVVHDPPDATDLQIKITDNSHYITEIYEKDQIITWSTATPALVPYIQGIKYDVDILAVPVAPVIAPANGEEVYAMGMIENKFPKIKIFWFTNTHSLLNDNLGTPEFYQLMKRAAEYTFDNIPQPNALKENNFTGFNFVAYPNPASGEVTIRFNAPESMQAQIVLLDVAGRQMDIFYENITHIGNNFVTLKVDDYQKGIYFVKLQMGENSAYSKILLK